MTCLLACQHDSFNQLLKEVKSNIQKIKYFEYFDCLIIFWELQFDCGKDNGLNMIYSMLKCWNIYMEECFNF